MADGVQIGLKDLHYALLTKDDATGVIYGAPDKITGAINAKISPKVNTSTLYADDGPDEVASALGEITVELQVKDLSLDIQAALLGHTVTGGVLTKNASDIAPYIAIGFKSLKSNGKYRYVWLFKGKFQLQEQEYKTQEDTPEFQTPSIQATFVKRQYDGDWQKITDEDHPDYTAGIGANWFAAVSGVAPNALTCTPSPADDDSAVAVGSNITWTFNNAIQASDVTSGNFMVMKADGTVVAGALTVDAERKIVTLNPTVDLGVTSTYIAIASKNVRDIYGQTLAANSVTNFATA